MGIVTEARRMANKIRIRRFVFVGSSNRNDLGTLETPTLTATPVLEDLGKKEQLFDEIRIRDPKLTGKTCFW